MINLRKMLRLNIFKQLPRITLISFDTKPVLQWCNTEQVARNVPQPIKYSTRNISISSTLEKYNRKSGSRDVESDSDEETDPEFKDERDSKVIKTKVNSLRADLLLKAGLGVARNKIENIFYESRIRVNGKKLAKKSVQLNEGDEIDVIRGLSQENPSHLVVSRVIILTASEREDGYSVNLRRYKGLLVDNYSGANAFKTSSVSDHLK